MKTITLLSVFLMGCLKIANAAQLTESTITEIVKDVNLLPAIATAATPAKLKDILRSPDKVRTGADSRAELTASDRTITRVGANTVFSFEAKDRVLNLEKGSLLFNSPKGAGGGMIKSAGAAAAVLGTTLIVATTGDGGFKVIILEGKGKATLPNGKSVVLLAGQLVFVRPGESEFGPVLDINLARLVAGSKLVTGFSSELGSLPLINDAISRQTKQLAKGRARDTGLSAEDFAKHPRVGNGTGTIDDTTYTTSRNPFMRGLKPTDSATRTPTETGAKQPGVTQTGATLPPTGR